MNLRYRSAFGHQLRRAARHRDAIKIHKPLLVGCEEDRVSIRGEDEVIDRKIWRLE